MNTRLNSYLVLFVTKHMHVLQMLISDTRAMGRVLDVVWCNLSVTFTTGLAHIYFYKQKIRTLRLRDTNLAYIRLRGSKFPTAKVYTPILDVKRNERIRNPKNFLAYVHAMGSMEQCQYRYSRIYLIYISRRSSSSPNPLQKHPIYNGDRIFDK